MGSKPRVASLTARRQLLAILGVVLLFCATLAGTWLAEKNADAATLSTINFQARLMNLSGSVVPDGFYNIEFKLYNASTSSGSVQGSCTGDANCLWTETYYDSNGVTAGNDNRVRVANGYVTVSLGSLTAFPSTINWDQEVWLTMNVGGSTQTATPTWDGEMSPRLKLTAVPYAFRAGQLAKFNSGTNFTSTLSIVQPTGGNQTFQIPDQAAAGTYNLLVAPSGSDGYVKLQTASPGSQQTGHFNINGTGIAGTALQAPLFQTADGTGASTALTLRTGNATTSGNTGGLTIATGNATSGNSGNIGIDVGTASGTAGTISIGTSQATGITIGRTGVATTFSGPVGIAANQNLTLSSGTGVLGQTFTNSAASSAQTLSVTNSNSGASSVAVNGHEITLVGTATSGGINSNTAIRFVNPSAATNNNFYGLHFAGTGYTDILRVGSTQIMNGSGVIQSAGVSGSYTGITGVGTLAAGELGVGFTTVVVARGGTGATTLTQNGVLYGNGTSAIGATAVGATGECLVGNTGNAPSWSACATGTVTLQTAYNASTDPELTLGSAATAGISIRDNATPISGNLLEVQNNARTITYLAVTTSGISVTGDVNAGTGTIIGSNFRSTDQTAGSTSSAATTFRSGNVSGATSNSGAITLQSGNSSTSGHTGNVSITSGNATAGNSGNVSVDVGTASATLGQLSFGTANAATINIGSVGSTSKATTINIANTTDATNAQAITLGSTANNTGNLTVIQGGSNTTQAIQLLPNTAGGIMIGASAGTGTITLGQSTASNSISIGSANLTSGTPTQGINIANGSFSTGAAVTVNILSGTAGSAGSATLNLGNNDRVTQIDIGNVAADAARTLNFGSGSNTVAVDTINIGTGNTTVAGGKTIHIGDGTPSGSGTNLITIGTAATAGSTVTLQGVIKLSNPGATTANAVALCRDSSTTNLIACDSGAGGPAFIQGGNSFGATGTLGTNDNNDLVFERNNATRMTVGNTAITLATDIDLTLQGGGAFISNPQAQSNAEAFGAGADVSSSDTLAVGNGATADSSAATALGRAAWAQQNNTIALGYSTHANGVGSIAIGYNADVQHADSIALGEDATTTATNQLVIGSSSQTISSVYIGNGVTNSAPAGFTLQTTGSSTAGTAGANLTIQGGAGASATTGSAGGNVLIAGGNAGGSGNNAGGTITLQGGLDTNTGAPGKVLVKNSADSTTAFQVQNAAGTSTLLNVDTTNGYVGIGTATPARPLHVAVNNSVVNGQVLKLDQAGSGDVGIEFTENGQSFYAGVDATDHKFKISSSAVNSTTQNMGYTTVGGSIDSANRNFMSATKFTAGATGTVNTIYAYIESQISASPNNKGQAAIYADNGSGSPGAILGSSTGDTTLTGAAWNAFPITSVSVTSGTVYWLVYNTNATSDDDNNLHYDAGGVDQYKWNNQTYGTWPGSYGTPDGDSDNQGSIYAVITTGTSSNNFLGSLFQMNATGETLFQNSANSTAAFRIQNVAGIDLLALDTTNAVLNLGVTGTTATAGTVNVGTSTGATQLIRLGATGSGTAATGTLVNIQGGTTANTAVTIGTNGAGGITMDTGTTGSILIGAGTSNNAKTITIGPTATKTSTTTIQIGVNTAGSEIIHLGSTGTANAAAGTTVNIQGGTTVNTAVTIGTNGAGGITIDSGTTGTINIGNGANAKAVVLGSMTGASTTTIQGGSGNGVILQTNQANAAVLVKSTHASNSTAAFQVQNASSTPLLTADTANTVVKVGTVGTPTMSGVTLFATFGEYTDDLRVGDATNRFDFDKTTGPNYLGSARPSKRITLIPEYPGATFTGDGTSNSGTMTSDFCSGTSRKTLNTTFCASTDEHNYYAWNSASGTNDYDVYIRYQMPSDYSRNAANTSTISAINMFGWRTGSSNLVELAMFNATGAQCGATTNVATGTAVWTEVALGSIAGDTDCDAIVANDVIIFRVKLTSISATDFALAGAIRFDYLAKF
jgi:hypothetical protein